MNLQDLIWLILNACQPDWVMLLSERNTIIVCSNLLFLCVVIYSEFFSFCIQSYWIWIILRLNSIWPMDRTLTGIIMPVQSRSDNNGSERILHIPPEHEPNHQMQFGVKPRKPNLQEFLFFLFSSLKSFIAVFIDKTLLRYGT